MKLLKKTLITLIIVLLFAGIGCIGTDDIEISNNTQVSEPTS